jgi:hypothetical protein
MITPDVFAEQITRVRVRFAASLNDKLAESFAALDKLSGSETDSIETTIVAHRRLHEICGIAPTLGFVVTGEAARAACTAIREAAKTKRVPTPGELAALKVELEHLRAAATVDLRSYSDEAEINAP